MKCYLFFSISKGDNQNDDEIQDEELNSGDTYSQDIDQDNNNSASPDSSAQQDQQQQSQQQPQQIQQQPQQTQQQQQPSIQSSVVSSESAVTAPGVNQQAQTTSTTIRLNPSASSFNASVVSTTTNYRSFGSNQQQQSQQQQGSLFWVYLKKDNESRLDLV